MACSTGCGGRTTNTGNTPTAPSEINVAGTKFRRLSKAELKEQEKNGTSHADRIQQIINELKEGYK